MRTLGAVRWCLVHAGSVTLVCLGVALAPASQDSPQIIRSGALLVPVEVRVTDPDRRPVTGLTRDDFTILEDGVPQTITLFESPAAPAQGAKERPRIFVVYLWSWLPSAHTFGFDRAAAKFIRERLRPSDRVAVSAFGRITDLSTDHEEVARVIERIRAFQASIDREPDRIERIRALYAVKSRPMPDLQAAFDAVFRLPSAPGRTLPVVQREGIRSVLQPIEDDIANASARRSGLRFDSRAMQATIESRRYTLLNFFSLLEHLKRIEGEKHVIHYGNLHVPSAESDRRIATLASDARVVVHGIVHQGGSVSRGVDVEARMSFRQIAEMTGGSVSFAEWPDRVLTRIDESTRSTYVLAYRPSRAELDGTQRRITVTVKRARGATVQHRRSYLAQEVTVPYDSRPIIVQDRIMTAGEYGGEIDDLDLQLAATVNGKVVDVDVRIDPTHLTFEDAGDQRLAQLETATFCTDARERLVGELWQTLDLRLSRDAYAKAPEDGVRHRASVPVTARPGFCKVVIYDYPSDRIGSKIVRLR